MVGTALLVGGAFGVRHAFEADHLAAVATLVKDGDRPASTGAAWGLGHSIPILSLGTMFLVLDLQIPASLTTGFELVVAVILVILGVRVIAGREALGTVLLRHIHSDDDEPSGFVHRHVTVGTREIGVTHSHSDEESFAVGIVHGFAGSGGVVIALAAAAPTVSDGAGFLTGFSVATIISMGIVSWGWGHGIQRTTALRTVAGLASVAVGVLLFAETLKIMSFF